MHLNILFCVCVVLYSCIFTGFTRVFSRFAVVFGVGDCCLDCYGSSHGIMDWYGLSFGRYYFVSRQYAWVSPVFFFLVKIELKLSRRILNA